MSSRNKPNLNENIDIFQVIGEIIEKEYSPYDMEIHTLTREVFEREYSEDRSEEENAEKILSIASELSEKIKNKENFYFVDNSIKKGPPHLRMKRIDEETWLHKVINRWIYLFSMSNKKLIECFEETYFKIERRERYAKREKDELRFFNHPKSLANYSYWAEVPAVSIDEAIALSLDKDPRAVNPNTIVGIAESDFVETFQKRKLILERAIAVKHLHATKFEESYLISIQDLINWSESRNNFKYPDGLKESVSNIKDYGAENKRLRRLLAARKKKLEELKEYSIDEIPPKRKSSYQKIILGISVKKYKFKSTNNSASENISNDLLELDLGVSSETIRNIIKEAVENLDYQFDIVK